MLYALFGEDRSQSLDKRRSVISAHRARLQQLQTEGRLVLGGAMPAIDGPDPGPAGFVGSLIVAEFDSLAEAEDWLGADPYVTEGVFARSWARPFTQALPL